MDRLLARAAYFKKRSLAILAKRRENGRRLKMNELRRDHTRYQKLITEDRQRVREHKREDKALGPIKPRRAVNEKELELYSAVMIERMRPPLVPFDKRISYWNIVPNDRVVILKGPDRHKIGVVESISRDTNTLLVKDMNMGTVKVPDVYKAIDPNCPITMTQPMPVHYEDVRLVYPLADAAGEVRDTIVANISMSPVIYMRRESKRVWKRMVAGTETVIPWPIQEPKKKEDCQADTRIMDVENRTYVPTLLQSPFPSSVMDELRNKYSKFRTRHEKDYVEKIEDAERQGRAKQNWRVLSPLQELRRKERLEKKATGPPMMPESVMEAIGKVMAQKRPDLLKAAGV